MLPRTRVALILVVASVSLSCTTHVCHRATDHVEPEGYEAAHAKFVSVYNELDAAIAATPAWHTQREARLRVKGLADIATQHLNGLRPYALHDLISCGTIELGVRHIKVFSTPSGEHKDARGVKLAADADRQLEGAAGERAYVRIRRRIEAIECYAADGIVDPWLEAHVMPAVRDDLRCVQGLDDDTIAYFKKYRGNDRVLEMGVRAGHALALLDESAAMLPGPTAGR